MYMRQLAQRVQKQITITTGQVFFLASLLVFGLTIFGVSATAPKVSAAGECDTNAILYCGFTSNSGFIDTVKRNRDGLGHTDLQAIYAFAGLSSADYSRFVSSARQGTAYKDGRVVVDGQTVMTSTLSYGRNGYAGSPYSIGGKTYYRGTPAERWQQNSFQVRVLFDDKGTAEFVVIDVCGNPLTGNAVKSNAYCDMLNYTQPAGQLNAFNFTTNAHTDGLAKIVRYDYNFGDGTKASSTAANGAVPQKTYSNPGTYTVTVTVVATAPGGTTITRTCQKSVTVAKPGVTITKTVDGVKSKEVQFGKPYTYILTVKNTGTATLTGVVVTDVAPTGVQFMSTDKGTVTGNKLNYTIASLAPGASDVIRIQAKVTGYTDKEIINKACVDAPQVPGNPDACDSANVHVPIPMCVQLTGPSPSGLTYTFVATAKYGENIQFVSADFDFGDGKTASGVKPSGTTATTSHTYGAAGQYSVTATLRFDAGGTVITAPACRASVKPQTPPTPECKPGVPVGDVRCNPCQYNANYDAGDTTHCVAPAATLPETGAGNVIAVASLALVGGFLWYRHVIFRRHKREFMAADFGTSPLPLAEPLESPQPLANTPLAPQTQSKFSLRRKRQF